MRPPPPREIPRSESYRVRPDQLKSKSETTIFKGQGANDGLGPSQSLRDLPLGPQHHHSGSRERQSYASYQDISSPPLPAKRRCVARHIHVTSLCPNVGQTGVDNCSFSAEVCDSCLILI